MMKDGSSKMYYVPLEMMYNQKKVPTNWTVEKDWAWAYPTYQFALDGINAADVDSITIDPKNRMADINKENNLLTQ